MNEKQIDIVSHLAQILEGIQVPASIDPRVTLGTGHESWVDLLQLLGRAGWANSQWYYDALVQELDLPT